MKWVIFFVIGLLTLPSLAIADDFVLSGYTEVGERSTAEDYEEEDEDNDYTYQNYHLKLQQKVSDRLSYNIGSFIYDKDYKDKNSLDNISRIFNTKWSYYPRKSKEESLRLDFKLKYKEKRYDNTPRSEYDQILVSPKLTFKKKDLYAIDLSAGVNNYDYTEASEKDQLKAFGKIGGRRYFLEKRLMLTSSYKLEATDEKKINRERTKHNLRGGFDYIFDLPWLSKIITRGSWGERDTKEEEETDEDYDYEYWRYYARTVHKINPGLKTDLKYQYFKKDYLTADLDHRGFYIKNTWRYKILDDERNKIVLNLFGQHKDVEYTLKAGNDYQKETAELKATYQRKKNLPAGQAGWKTSATLQGNFYDFNDASKDKERYYVKLSAEKLFKDGDLVLSIDLKYRWTDYDEKNDTEQEAVRVTFKHKF